MLVKIFFTIRVAIRNGDKILIKTDEPNKEDFEKALTRLLKPEKKKMKNKSYCARKRELKELKKINEYDIYKLNSMDDIV
jgi:hypothetical protein